MIFSSPVEICTLKSMNRESTDLEIDPRLILTIANDIENIAPYDEIEQTHQQAVAQGSINVVGMRMLSDDDSGEIIWLDGELLK